MYYKVCLTTNHSQKVYIVLRDAGATDDRLAVQTATCSRIQRAEEGLRWRQNQTAKRQISGEGGRGN